MNLLDVRSLNWNIWNEIEKDYYFDNMVNGLIFDLVEVDLFWVKVGWMVLKDVYKVFGCEGWCMNCDFYNLIVKSNFEVMYVFLVGEVGVSYVDLVMERIGMLFKMMVQNQFEVFWFLYDEGELFLI